MDSSRHARCWWRHRASGARGQRNGHHGQSPMCTCTRAAQTRARGEDPMCLSRLGPRVQYPGCNWVNRGTF